MYKDSFAPMVNTIILIVKYYIYKQRATDKTISFVGVIQEIAKYKRIEELAVKIFHVNKHKDKWLMYDKV